MTKDEALELALEALEADELDMVDDGSGDMVFRKEQAIAAIKEALAKEKALQALHDENERLNLYKDAYAEQEPVAYGTWNTMLGKGNRMMMVRLDKGQDGCTVPLYTTPPQRKPLTDEQIDYIAKNYALNNPTTPLHFARAIEAAHGIKENT